MDFRIAGRKTPYPTDASILEGSLSCYDTLGDDSFDIDRDFLLHERSRYEFIRAQLSKAQQADLDVVDAYWRAHPKAFNADFEVFHIRENKKTAMEGWVEDGKGNAPAIPRSHWWWWPLDEEAA